MRKTPSPLYELKVTLLGIKPPIWRRLRVRSDITLRRLHNILQVALGWGNSHLHMFIAEQGTYGRPDPYGLLEEQKDDARTRLNKVLVKPKDSIVYEYDFGDGWQHKIVLEKILAAGKLASVATCVAGARACPPDDCGGVYGYLDLLETIADPKNPDYERMLDWLGGEFDPEFFDIDEVNDVLCGAARSG